MSKAADIYKSDFSLYLLTYQIHYYSENFNGNIGILSVLDS